METLKGTVVDLQSSTEFYRVEDDGPRKKINVTQFHLGARAVRYRESKAFAVRNGDLVLVAGRRGKNALVAVAIRNATTGAVMSPGATGWIVMIVVILIFGLMASAGLAVFVAPWLFSSFLLFIVGAGFVVRRAVQDREALAWVKMAVP